MVVDAVGGADAEAFTDLAQRGWVAALLDGRSDEVEDLTLAMKQARGQIIARGGLLLLVLAGWVVAYVWYLYLIISARGSIAASLRTPARSLNAA